ncbi:MAG: SBBP repeat-containing protein, partial [Bacteroidetes bacterium]|nr:SBBP repeat-containing protein [Bacteroidota bacterium]
MKIILKQVSLKTTALTLCLTLNTVLQISNCFAQPSFTWAKSMGGTDNDRGYSIAVDGSGNVYTTGVFTGTADFDPGAGNYPLTAAGVDGLSDIFISKLDASGNFVWAKRIGDTDNDRGYSIAVDGSGNVYTTGFFRGTVDFDPGAGSYPLTAAGSQEFFISKLDASGNFVWAISMSGISAGYSIAIDGSGYVYTTGLFWGT